MGILNSIKSILGVKAPERSDTPDAEKVKAAKTVTKPVTVKPAKPKAKAKANPDRQTRATLAKLTKVQIDELAKERLGVDLDRRKTKDDMIKAYMAAQKKG